MEQDKDWATLIDVIRTAAAQLPERQRIIFVAMRDDQATYGELAERLGIGVADVEREFAQALVAIANAADR